MPDDNKAQLPRLFKRSFTKMQLRGKHHIKLTPELNATFLQQCDEERRIPTDMIRIILEDYYAQKAVADYFAETNAGIAKMATDDGVETHRPKVTGVNLKSIQKKKVA